MTQNRIRVERHRNKQKTNLQAQAKQILLQKLTIVKLTNDKAQLKHERNEWTKEKKKQEHLQKTATEMDKRIGKFQTQIIEQSNTIRTLKNEKKKLEQTIKNLQQEQQENKMQKVMKETWKLTPANSGKQSRK